MSRLVKKLMVVLLSVFMFMGAVTTPVQAKGPSSNTNGWGNWWGWWWWPTQPTEPEPEEDPVVEEEPVDEEEPADEEDTPVVEEEPVYAEGPVYGESEHFTATVTFDATAMLPEGTDVSVNELDEGTPEYEAAKAAIFGEGAEADGFIAVDITLINGDEAVEPSADGTPVTVSVELKNLPAEAIAAADTMEIQHINEISGETETVATAEDITVTGEDTAEAEFEVGSFSTFALTWTNESGDEAQATIYWGYMDGEEFVELGEGSTVTLDTSASSVSVANSYEGYNYLSAVYCAPGKTLDQGSDMGSILYKTANGWECDVTVTGEDETQSVTRAPIEDGSNIYVLYFEPEQPNPSGAADVNVPSPTTTKSVTANGDGTYTIQLDIAGAIVTEDQSHYANVLIILDATQSMRGSKWTNAKAAMKALIETLTEGDNAANAGKIDFALVTFGRSATVVQNWTKNNAAFKTTCANISMVSTSGTNWEAGMRGGLYGVLNNMPDNDPTYTIFLTDGDPNVYYSSGSDTNYTNSGTTNGWNQNSTTSANASKDEAKTIAGKTSLYGIYCGDSGTTPSGDSYNRLVSVITGSGQGGKKTIAANADTIESEFKEIAETIAKEMGASGVSADDGVTALSSVSATVSGEAGGYEYYISTDGTHFSDWDDAPGAIYTPDNGVTWDLSEEGTLPAGTTYRVKFTVWPSQDALDLVADLNNGLKDYSTLDSTVKSQITDNGDGTYSLLTNTHLYTTYTFNNVEYTDKGDEGKNAMALDVETFTVKKVWHNDLDEREADEVKLIVTKDGKNYLYDEEGGAQNAVLITKDNGWVSDTIYISCGYITKDANGYTIKETGHDYSVKEPANYAYYWDLTANVYHPMVINGTPTMLILDDKVTGTDGTDYYTIGGHKYKVSTETENQLTAINDRRSNLNLTKVVDGTAAPETAEFKYEVTVGASGQDDIWFSVQDKDGAYVKDLKTDAAAEILDGAKTGFYYVAAGTQFYLYLKKDWNCRFINLPTGSTYTVEETEMPEGFELKTLTASINKGDGTAATVTQAKAQGTIDKPNTEYSLKYTNNYYGFFYVYHSSNNTIERISLKKNADGNGYVDTRITNDGKFSIVNEVNVGYLYGGYYKSYTGAKMTDAEIIAAEYTENNTSSAGVYNSTVKTTGFWTNDLSGCTPYTGAVSTAWKGKQAYTESGLTMTPAAGTVYYLKEVPEAYFTPGIYYVYDDRAEGKPLKKLYLLVPTDDGNYNGVASVNNIPAALTRKLYASYRITNDVTGFEDIKKANNVNEKCPRGYLTVWDVRDLISTGESYAWTPNFITKDGVTVTGTIKRTIVTGNGCYDADQSKRYYSVQNDVKAFYVYDTTVPSVASAN